MADIKKSYDGIEKQIKEELEGTQKSLKTSLYIKIGVLLIIIIYMSFLWHIIASFNATGAMQAMLGIVENNTEYREKMIADLNDSAETNVDEIYNQLNLAIPQIRMEIEKVIFEKIDMFALHIEEEFNISLEGYMKSKIEEINLKKKDATPGEKLTQLIGSLRNDFKSQTYAFTETLTSEISGDILDLNKELKKLQAGKNLTEKEKYQRALLSIWVKLLNTEIKEQGEEAQTE